MATAMAQTGATLPEGRFNNRYASNNMKSPDLQCILEKLRPFQREAFDFATTGKSYRHQWQNDEKPNLDPTLVGKGRILLADEMGLGKTVTSLAIMTNYMDEWPLLILCPASLRHTWPAEIEKFLPTLPSSAVYVVSGFDDTAFLKRRAEIKIVVATYSLLQTRSACARVLQQFDFQCVICDESHNLKEKKSQRCQLGLPLLHKAKRLVLLSGTPALARPVELWPQVYCIAPKLFGSYTAFTKKFCNAQRGRFGWDVSGISNANELFDNLRQIMVRRLKSDVLSELPPKQRSIIPIKMDSNRVKECRELVTELEATKLSVSELVGQDANDAHFEHRRLLMQAYQASGIGKANAVTEYLLDWLAGAETQKILVFAHHQHVMDALEQAVAKKYKGVGHIRIDGTVPSSERAVRVRKFQTNSQVRVAILSMTAAGVGLTLTAASSVLFAELHWTPGVLAQAEDRCHRIGQQNAVNVMYCVCKDESLSVDMRLWAMLGRKVGNLGRVIDGCKTASMNASESTVESKSSGEELSRFFAETSAANAKHKKAAGAPAKGSILNFFKPPAQTKEPKASSSSCSTRATTMPSRQNNNNKYAKSLKSSTPKCSPIEIVEWTCKTCTFDNSREMPASGWLPCKMCGECLVEESTAESESEVASSSFASQSPKSDDRQKNIVDLCGRVQKRRKQQASPEIVVLLDLDGSDEDVSTPRAAKKPRRTSSSGSKSEAIEINDDIVLKEMARPSEVSVIDVDVPISKSVVTPASQPRKGALSPSVLKFVVSKNSGRVSIHCAKSGNSFHFNFDIDQLITEETADKLLNAQVKRSSNTFGVSEKDVNFREDAVTQVASSLNLGSEKKTSRETQEQRRDEIKAFVRGYLSLREVEKKALKEWNNPVSSVNFKQTVAQIVTSSTSGNCKERYAGGAKERAVANAKAGTCTALDKSVLSGAACAWCAEALPDAAFAKGVESTYCSQACVEQGRLGRGGLYASTRVRDQVFGLEGGVCRKCGIDAHSLFLRISALEPPERLNALINAKWHLPKTGPALDRLLQQPKEGDFWQADHIKAVAEGGGGCGLENLQTLCTPCHRAETDKLRSRLRLVGGANNVQSPGRKQMDIRSAFQSRVSTEK